MSLVWIESRFSSFSDYSCLSLVEEYKGVVYSYKVFGRFLNFGEKSAAMLGYIRLEGSYLQISVVNSTNSETMICHKLKELWG